MYGEPVEIPQNERTTLLNSKLPYAIVKNLGEAFLRSHQKEFGLTTRCSASSTRTAPAEP